MQQYKNIVMNATDVRNNWTKVLDEVYTADNEITVEKSGIPVAVLISIEERDRFKMIEKERKERFKRLLARMQSKFADESEDEIMAHALAAVQEVREQLRREKKSIGR
jgi:prevent-host-death family protein